MALYLCDGWDESSHTYADGIWSENHLTGSSHTHNAIMQRERQVVIHVVSQSPSPTLVALFDTVRSFLAALLASETCSVRHETAPGAAHKPQPLPMATFPVGHPGRSRLPSPGTTNEHVSDGVRVLAADVRVAVRSTSTSVAAARWVEPSGRRRSRVPGRV